MSDDVSFRRREFKGSRLRCLMATSLADREVAAFLNQVVQPRTGERQGYLAATRLFRRRRKADGAFRIADAPTGVKI